MCGIGVAVDLRGNGRCDPWALKSMRHRGPDGHGSFVDPEQGLVMEHCRLAIIDPENRESDQPFRDPTGRWTIVYNGELFNYRALRHELERRGARFRTNSDTEVVLNALILDGLDALETFRGMFAFVFWDAAERRLLAARDQVGVKPLYYTVANGVFVAASELRTVLAHPAVKPSLDPSHVVEYLAFGFVADSRTLVRGVSKLPAGHALTLVDGTVTTSEYWDALIDDPVVGDGDVEHELLNHLDSAVAAALVSDVPVSLMLSGGLDSSAIAALAVRHVAPESLTAYSVSFGLPTDESAAAARLAGELGIRHRGIMLTRDGLADGFGDWLRGLDVPSANPTWVAISAIASAVASDGNRVLLGGDGGDEVFGGYNRWMTYLRFHERYWRRLPSACRHVVGTAARPFARGLGGDIARRARHGGELFVGSRPFHDDDLGRYLGPVGLEAFRQRPPETQVQHVRTHFDERRPGGDQLAWMSYVALKTDLVEDYLVRLDTMGMGESVEGRVPLLDAGLVRFGLSLSQRAKIGPNYEQKALFRRTVSSLLPEHITQRPKQGFCPPVGGWASSLLASHIPSDSALIEDGLIAPDATQALAKVMSTKASFALWGLGTLAVWCEANL